MVAKVVFLCPRLQFARRYWISSATYFPTAAGVILLERRLMAPKMFLELSPADKVWSPSISIHQSGPQLATIVSSYFSHLRLVR